MEETTEIMNNEEVNEVAEDLPVVAAHDPEGNHLGAAMIGLAAGVVITTLVDKAIVPLCKKGYAWAKNKVQDRKAKKAAKKAAESVDEEEEFEEIDDD